MDLVQTGIFVAAAGYICTLLRPVWSQVRKWLVGRLCVTLTVHSSDPIYADMDAWLAQQLQGRHRDILIRGRDAAVHLTAAYGTSYFRWRGWLASVTRERLNMPTYSHSDRGSAHPEEMRLTIYFASRNNAVVSQLLEDAIPSPEAGLRVFRPQYSIWSECTAPRRPLATLVGEPAKQLLADARWFRENEALYRERGVPYRRGYLLYGPPGNGKSSAIAMLATELDCGIYVLRPGQVDSVETLENLVSRVAPGSIVVIEDVDAAFTSRPAVTEPSATSGNDRLRITLADLLNTLDGLLATTGRILVMTTNHRNRLDPALVRPGRCDLQLEFANPDSQAVAAMAARFNVQVSQLATVGQCAAAVQNELLQLGGMTTRYCDVGSLPGEAA